MPGIRKAGVILKSKHCLRAECRRWRNSATWLLTATAYCDSLSAVRGNLLLRAFWHLKDVLTVKWNLKLGTVWLFLFPSRFHLFGVRLHYQFDSHMPLRSGGGSLMEITDSLFWDAGTESSSLWEKERRNCGCFLLSLAKSWLFSSLNLFLSAVSSHKSSHKKFQILLLDIIKFLLWRISVPFVYCRAITYFGI